MIPMRLADAAAAMGAEVRGSSGVTVQRVSTDSRRLEPGDLFFALRGPNFDGHEFVPTAFAKGAVGCICDRRGETKGIKATGPVLLVDDTVAALGRLASHYRKSVLPPSTVIVGVTGSNGKTTTKFMIDQVLNGSMKGRPAPKSFNNQIGVPLTLLSADGDDRYVVVEMGTNSPGEIGRLAAMGSPNVGVVTSIGEAHVEGLGDLAGIAAEKASLLDHIRDGGLAVVNIDRSMILSHLSPRKGVRLVTVGSDPRAKLWVGRRRSSIRGSTFDLDGRFTVELPIPGTHHATNATAAFAVGRWFGVDCEEILEQLRTFSPPEGRTRVTEVGGITLVDDSYNANPASVRAAIEALSTHESGRRVLVLGDMLELGSVAGAFHKDVVRAALGAGIEVFVPVGPMMVQASDELSAEFGGTQVVHCADAEEAGDVVHDLALPGDAVWVKASRAMKLDLVVDRLQKIGHRSFAAA